MNPTSPPARSAFLTRAAIFAGTVALGIGACLYFKAADVISPPGVELTLPAKVSGFTGEDIPISEAEKIILPEDTGIAKKLYRNEAGESIQCQIVLSGTDRRSIHRPEICLSGQGWEIRSGTVVPVTLQSGSSLDIMVLDMARPVTMRDGRKVQQEALYAYWFVSDEALTPYHYERIARGSLDLLLKNKFHRWAYVIVMAPVTKGFIPGGKDRDQTLDMIEDFIRETVPFFQINEMPMPHGPQTAAIRP